MSLVRRRRIGPVILLLVVGLFVGGCVYLRLLEFKGQLAEFEKNFSTDLSDGFQVNCKNPVLLGDDLRWLGAVPEKIQRTGNSEHWIIRWVKDPPRDTPEVGFYDIEVQADLVDRKVQSIRIPESYFATVPKELFLNVLRSAGRAKVDRRSRQATVDTAGETSGAAPPPVDLGSIEKMLGAPTERVTESGGTRYRYIFRPQTPSGPGKPIEATFFFTANTGSLRRFVGKLPKGTLNFEFSTPAEEKP